MGSTTDPRSEAPGRFRLGRRIGEGLRFHSGLALLGLMLLGGTLIGACARPFLSAQRFRWFLRGWAAAIFRGYLRAIRRLGLLQVDLSELDRLRDEPSLIIAPNHPSLLDAALVISRLPRTVCIMKASLCDNLFLGAGARMAGYIPNDSPRSMVRLAVQALNDGGQLLIFPEGTRSSDAPIGPLKPAFAAIARRARAPVQTIFIEAESRYLSKGWPLWRRPVALPLRYRVRLGPRVAPEGSTDDIVARVTACLRSGLSSSGPAAAPSAAPFAAPSTASTASPPASSSALTPIFSPGDDPSAAGARAHGGRLRSDDFTLSTIARLPIDD
ncbi:MAG: lysophospholipid acyltransferase family protein [Burkholderiaceae bacterium]